MDSWASAGGGGHGSAADRDPQRVAEDVEQGRLSVESALSDYGVVVEHGRVNDTLTRQTRQRGHFTSAQPFDLGPERRAFDESTPDSAADHPQ